MVVDSSVLVAILKDEEDAEDWKARLADIPTLSVSAASYVEIAMVLAGKQVSPDLTAFDRFLQGSEIRIEPVTEQDALFARDAFLRFGKGRHPAGLNFGDCFSYALAQRLREPLLYKGEDFTWTDVRRLKF